jgi:hypothetical protein
MKKLICLSFIVSFAMGCKKTETTTSETKSATADTTTAVATDTTKVEKGEAGLYACPMHPEVTGKKDEKCPKCGMSLNVPVSQIKKESPEKPVTTATVTAPAKPIQTKAVVTNTSVSKHAFNFDAAVAEYLKIKKALTINDSKGAAIAAKALYASLTNAGPNTPTSKGGNQYSNIANDAKEHAQSIADNAGKIALQREYFAMLTKDINDLIAILGTNQKLSQDEIRK